MRKKIVRKLVKAIMKEAVSHHATLPELEWACAAAMGTVRDRVTACAVVREEDVSDAGKRC